MAYNLNHKSVVGDLQSLEPLILRQKSVDQAKAKIEIYQSLLKDPIYVFDDQTERILTIELDVTNKTGKTHTFATFLNFGETELVVCCKNRSTGEEVSKQCVYDYV